MEQDVPIKLFTKLPHENIEVALKHRESKTNRLDSYRCLIQLSNRLHLLNEVSRLHLLLIQSVN